MISAKLEVSVILPTIHKEGPEQRETSRDITVVCGADTSDSRDIASGRDVTKNKDSG